MVRKAKSILVGVILLAVGLVAPAYGASDVVDHGESIQAAIDAAQPGDTIVVRPGTYHESLEIRKEGIKLLGSGAVLTPPQEPPETLCNEGPFVVGMCIAGEVDEATFEAGEPLANVTVDGFTIEGFGMGIFAVATENLSVSHNVFRDNAVYGAFALSSTGTRYLYNSARNNGVAGYYIGDSPHADATVLGNSSEGSLIGLFFRSARGARVAHNVFSDNCTGVSVVSDPAPAGDLTLADNEIFENHRLCEFEEEEGHEGHEGDDGYEEEEGHEGDEEGQAQEEEEPTFSGIGIALSGAQNVVVRRNNVWGNEPAGEADFAGGILVFTDPFTGAVPSEILVRGNRSFDNKPADLVWDETGSGIRFVANRCGSSKPQGLC